MRRFVRRLFNNWPLEARGGRSGDPDVRRAGPVAEHAALSGPDPGPLRQRTARHGQAAVHAGCRSTQIRYFAPSGVLVAASSFLATIDLAGYEGKVGVFQVPINVTSPDSRVTILGFDPQFATVELDALVSRADVPVKVVHGPVPDGLTLGKVTVDPETVTISGAASLVSQVDSVRADVAIQSGGIDVDEDVRLVPVDKLGNARHPGRGHAGHRARDDRRSSPTSRARRCRSTRSSPARRRPASRSKSVTVSPQVALVAGDASDLDALARRGHGAGPAGGRLGRRHGPGRARLADRHRGGRRDAHHGLGRDPAGDGDAHVQCRAPAGRRQQHAHLRALGRQRAGHDRRFDGRPRPVVRGGPGDGPRRHRPQGRDPRRPGRPATCRSGPRSSPSARRPWPSPSARPRSPRRRAARHPSREADPGWPACSAPTGSAVSPMST